LICKTKAFIYLPSPILAYRGFDMAKKGGSSKGLKKARCVRKKLAEGMSKAKARKACKVKGA